MVAIVEKVSHLNQVNIVGRIRVGRHVLVSGSNISRIGTGQDLAHRVVSHCSRVAVLISNRLRLTRGVEVGIDNRLSISIRNL